MDSDSDCPFSPSAFIADLSPPPIQLALPHGACGLGQFEHCSVEEGTFGSEKSARKKLAGLKSREKKKRRLELLEESVREISAELEACECALSSCKNQLVEALRTSVPLASPRPPPNTPIPSLSSKGPCSAAMETWTV